MKQFEEGASVAELAYDIHLLRLRPFAYANHRGDMRVRPNLDAGHYLPFELLDQVGVGKLELFYSNLLPPPGSLEHFRGRSGSHLPLEVQLFEVNQELVGVPRNLLHDEPLDVGCWRPRRQRLLPLRVWLFGGVKLNGVELGYIELLLSRRCKV